MRALDTLKRYGILVKEQEDAINKYAAYKANEIKAIKALEEQKIIKRQTLKY